MVIAMSKYPWLIGLPGGLGDSIIQEPLIRKMLIAADGAPLYLACNRIVVPLFDGLQGVTKAFDICTPHILDKSVEGWEWVIDLASVPWSAWLHELSARHHAFRPEGSMAHFLVDGEQFEHRTFKKHLPGREGSPNLPAWMIEAPIVSACLRQSHWDWLAEGLYPEFQFKRDPQMDFPGESDPFVLFIPCGTGTHRRWPSDRWIMLAERFHQAGYGVKTILGPEEMDLVQAFKEIADEMLILAPMRQIAALATQASFCIAHDCGPMHLAAACGARTLAIFGPTNPRCWFPYNPSITRCLQVYSPDICPWGELSHLIGLHWQHWPTVDAVWQSFLNFHCPP